ncbi:hypothetical protein ACVIWU_007033 [Bradyrhizobium sp. USDA 4509]|uniref:hypothetical protein n=1 Tax=Bradyrhizobium elkanii TaxID=29448 RepID=UPI00114CC3C4|nr:hypothetical protein [Bradyrhizobium elkanii]
MPDDKRTTLPKPARRPESALSVNVSIELDSQGTQTATFQAFCSRDSIRPIGLLENAPVAPEIQLTTAANWALGAVIRRRVVARKGTGEANTTNAVAILQAVQPNLGTASRPWGLHAIKRRCAPNSSASRTRRRPLRGHGDVLSPVG